MTLTGKITCTERMMSVQIQERGSVIQVKVLGTLLLIDEGMCELLQTFAGFNKVFVIFFFLCLNNIEFTYQSLGLLWVKYERKVLV